MPAPGMHSGVATDDALNLSMSEHAVPLYEAVKAFIQNEVEPITDEFFRLGAGPRRALGLRRGPARAARRRQGQGEGQRAVELLPPERRDR